MKINKGLKLCLAVVAMLALLCAPALAKVVSPGADFYYLDKANVLSQELEGEIFFANKLLYEQCGAQIVVVTLDTTGVEAIDDYAYDLFNSWGIGDAAKNNGFLLLLAIGDDDYYARTGSGLDSRFSAGAIKDYYDKYLEDDFAAGDYEAGVRKFFEAVFERISKLYNANVTIADGKAAYRQYIARNDAANGFGGYTGSRRNEARNTGYGRDGGKVGFGIVIFVVLLILFVVIMSRGRRARMRSRMMPPPPPPPMGFGIRPTRRTYHSGLGFMGRPSGFSSGPSRSSFGGGSVGRSSFGGGGSRSSSSFGRSSSGFGGGFGGGGRSSGGGAGRGRH